jgi:hypothetical protein
LFTKEEAPLKRIVRTDWVGSAAQANNSELDAELMTTIRMENRPGTGSKNPVELSQNALSLIGEDGRPLTIAITAADLPKIVAKPRLTDGIVGTEIRIDILSTWGDAYYTGLTGLAVLGLNGDIITQFRIEAHPRDMNIIPGYSGDYRTLDKVANGVN